MNKLLTVLSMFVVFIIVFNILKFLSEYLIAFLLYIKDIYENGGNNE